MKNISYGVSALATIFALSAVSHAQIKLGLVANVDLSGTSVSTSSSYIGNNPSALAWNGSSAWVAGYTATAGNTGIVRVDNVLGVANIGTAFGVIATNGSRGFTSLALKNNTLGASWDNGAGNVNSLRGFDAANGNQLWATGGGTPDATRRGNGIAVDPGFNGGGTNQGFGYLSIGSGRRHLLNDGTGAYINGQNSGAIMNFAPVSTTWRDLAFDPVTGDLYTRESNRVGKAVRSADNAFTGAVSTVLGTLTTATTIDNQNISFVNSTQFGDFLIFNNRTATGGGQGFSSVVTAFDKNGAALSIDWNGFNPATGNGAYDFAWDAGTQTLAMTDFANRRLYVFNTVPEPSTMVALGLGALALVRKRRKK